MPDIFLSYSREDRLVANRFAEAFKAQQFDVWWDAGLRSGEAYDEVTETALREARAVVVLWSRTSVSSRWVRAEATLADRNRTLVPCTIEPCDRPIMFELTQTADLSHWRGEPADPVWRQFVDDVRRFVAARGTPLPTVPAQPPALARRPGPARPTVLVVPFVNMGGDIEQEYFCDGVSEDLLTDLGRLSALSVVSRNTAFALKGKTIAAAQLARELNVSHILEGSIRKSGQRVRITATLVDAASDTQLWAERFDRTLDDIFAIQDEISAAIVAVLKLRLAPAEKRALVHHDTGNSEAYELFLLARQLAHSGSERVSPLIRRICHRVIELDPSFARAWAQIAQREAEEIQRGVGPPDSDGGRAAAERALALDPELPDAHAAMAYVTMRADAMAWEQIGRHVDAALRLDPNHYDARFVLGYLRLAQRDFTAAINELERVIELDPDAIAPCGMAQQAYAGLGDPQKLQAAARRSLAVCEKALAGEPDHGQALGFLVGALVHLGEAERARAWARRAMLFVPDNLRMLYNIACAMSNLREAGIAFDLLEAVTRKANAGWIAWIANDSDWDPLRNEARYAAIMAEAKARFGPAAAAGKS